MINIIGCIIILDGILSILLVKDKKLVWQVGRAIRIALGLVLLLL